MGLFDRVRQAFRGKQTSGQPDQQPEVAAAPKIPEVSFSPLPKSISGMPKGQHIDRLGMMHATDIGFGPGFGPDQQGFWGYKEQRTGGRSKADYLEMVSHIPEVRERLNNGESLESLMQDSRVGACATQYFSPGNMIQVESHPDGHYEYSTGGRHRIAAVQELEIEIPVQINEYGRKGDYSISPWEKQERYDALMDYMQKHGYSEADRAAYEADPEWQRLHSEFDHPVEWEKPELSDWERDADALLRRRYEETHGSPVQEQVVPETTTDTVAPLEAHDMATGFDVDRVRDLMRTKPGKAVFWSGTTGFQNPQDMSDSEYAGGEERATDFARAHDGKTLEMLMEEHRDALIEAGFPYDEETGRFVYSDGSPNPDGTPSKWGDTRGCWDQISDAFAEGASGQVRVVFGMDENILREDADGNIHSYESTWQRAELARIKQNPNITGVSAFAPYTEEEVESFTPDEIVLDAEYEPRDYPPIADTAPDTTPVAEQPSTVDTNAEPSFSTGEAIGLGAAAGATSTVVQSAARAEPLQPVSSQSATLGDRYQSSYADRIRQPPSLESNRWAGERGESVCALQSDAAHQIMEERGISGVQYQDGVPDFSPFSESTVKLGYDDSDYSDLADEAAEDCVDDSADYSDMADDIDSGSYDDSSFDSSDASFDSGDTGSFDGGGDSIE